MSNTDPTSDDRASIEQYLTAPVCTGTRTALRILWERWTHMDALCEQNMQLMDDLRIANERGDAWRWLFKEDTLTIAELRAALVAARAEVDRWGYGDMHYGNTPRDPSVLRTIALIDEALAAAPVPEDPQQ